jgi:hypothetical protein
MTWSHAATWGRVVAEQRPDAVAQLVDVEVAGVDDHVGLGLHRLEQRPLGSMASLDGLGRRSIGWRRRVLS